MIFDARKRGNFMMKQYTVGVTVRHKKLLKVSAHSEEEAILKAEMTLFDTDAVTFDGDNLVSADVGIESQRDDFDDDFDDDKYVINRCDIHCSGCPDYDSRRNICHKDGICGEEYDFPPAYGGKNG